MKNSTSAANRDRCRVLLAAKAIVLLWPWMSEKSKRSGLYKYRVFFAATAACFAPLQATAGTQINLSLRSQLWSGPAVHARLIGAPKTVKATLEIPNAPGSADRRTLKFVEGDLEFQVTFLLARPQTGASPYAVFQTRLLHATKGLIAECSNYDSLASPEDIGVGACSGAVDGEQVGVSYFR